MSRIDEIRARAQSAIKGPWDWMGNTATDQVYLATRDRGRLMILTISLRHVEYVYDHYECEQYTLEQASQKVETSWCPYHSRSGQAREGRTCVCFELRDWLSGSVDPEEGHRYFIPFGNSSHELDGRLVRAVQTFPELRFPEAPNDGWTEEAIARRQEHGGYLKSYRDFVRYEVLGRLEGGYFRDYRTIAEYERDTGESHEEKLYREDFFGLDTPEAEFIAHAREDVDWLLARIDELESST